MGTRGRQIPWAALVVLPRRTGASRSVREERRCEPRVDPDRYRSAPRNGSANEDIVAHRARLFVHGSRPVRHTPADVTKSSALTFQRAHPSRGPPYWKSTVSPSDAHDAARSARRAHFIAQRAGFFDLRALDAEWIGHVYGDAVRWRAPRLEGPPRPPLARQEQLGMVAGDEQLWWMRRPPPRHIHLSPGEVACLLLFFSSAVSAGKAGSSLVLPFSPPKQA